MRVVILAGGLGTRLQEETTVKPKPMVEIGGRPILWHIMKHYAHYGFREFVVALGYKGECIKRHFLDYHALNSNITVDLATGQVNTHAKQCEDWLVHLVDTGIDTNTGGRVKRLQRWLDAGTFMVTYGDGVCDVDLRELVAISSRLAARGHGHGGASAGPLRRLDVRRRSGRRGSPRSRKPAKAGSTAASWFASRRFSTTSTATPAAWRSSALERLAEEGQLAAYRHDGFWQCMDTLRDKRQLEALVGTRHSTLEGLEMNAFWQDRPTLVTGATGLVGGWLVSRLLDAGADVVCLVRDWVPQSELVRSDWTSRVRIVRGDVCDQPLLERVLGEYEVDTVFHLAAQAIVGVANRNPVSTFESNIRGTWTVLEACRRSPAVKQIVTASSDKAYGDGDQLPYREEAPLAGRHPYDVSKSCADLIARSLCRNLRACRWRSRAAAISTAEAT